MQQDQKTSQTKPKALSRSSSISSKRDNSLFGRVIESKLFWTVFVVIAFGLPLYQSFKLPPVKQPPVLSKVPDFELSNQDGDNVKWSDFRGTVLVVNFVFTSCPSVCPLMTQQMAKVQSRLLRSYPTIKLVSISVDPDNDTPEVLKAYSEKYKAENRLWSFLTGPIDTIEEVVVEGFKMARVIDKNPEDANLFEITHGEHFVIVDQLGQIRAYKHARNNEEINDIVRTVAILANSRPSTELTTEIDAGNAPLGR